MKFGRKAYWFPERDAIFFKMPNPVGEDEKYEACRVLILETDEKE